MPQRGQNQIGTSLSHTSLASPTLIETASLISEGTIRGANYTDNKSDVASTVTWASSRPLAHEREVRAVTVVLPLTITGSGAVVGSVYARPSAMVLLRLVGFYPGGIKQGSPMTLYPKRVLTLGWY